jgi:hypothetical protein
MCAPSRFRLCHAGAPVKAPIHTYTHTRTHTHTHEHTHTHPGALYTDFVLGALKISCESTYIYVHGYIFIYLHIDI